MPEFLSHMDLWDDSLFLSQHCKHVTPASWPCDSWCRARPYPEDPLHVTLWVSVWMCRITFFPDWMILMTYFLLVDYLFCLLKAPPELSVQLLTLQPPGSYLVLPFAGVSTV